MTESCTTDKSEKSIHKTCTFPLPAWKPGGGKPCGRPLWKINTSGLCVEHAAQVRNPRKSPRSEEVTSRRYGP